MPEAAALEAAAPRVEWPEKRSVSTLAAFSSFLIQADIVELLTWECCLTEPMNLMLAAIACATAKPLFLILPKSGKREGDSFHSKVY
ncbi:hypothetical protein OUZ56_010035 [Daphnia magna]|uniref:Uncharacterized protein n=1 Tax=Daphnia magna TaxID=35525 RepID=A0ABR0AHL7_9CRUS|nr:hypothetical protein OUZ56_010035 [Daphnia magna]